MSLIEELRTVIAADPSSTEPSEPSLAETSQAQWEAGAKMIQVGAAGGITRLIQAKLDKLQNEFKSAEQRMAHFKKIGVGETESPALMLGPLREMQDLVKFIQRLIKQAVDQTGADLNEGLDGDDTLVLDEGAPRSRAEFAKQVTSMASELAKAGSTVDRMRSGLDDMKTSVGFLPPTIAGKTATYTRQGMIKQLETLDASLERASGELESATSVIGGVRAALSGGVEESAGTEYREGLDEAKGGEVLFWIESTYEDASGAKKTSKDSWLAKWGKPSKAGLERIAGQFSDGKLISARIVRANGDVIATWSPSKGEGVFPTGPTVVEEVEALFEKKGDEEEEEEDDEEEEDESEDESEDEEEEDDADDMEEGATPGARSKGTGYGKSETSKAGEFWSGKFDKQDATPERKKEFNKAQRAGKKKHIDAQMKGEGTLSAELAALLNES